MRPDSNVYHYEKNHIQIQPLETSCLIPHVVTGFAKTN